MRTTFTMCMQILLHIEMIGNLLPIFVLLSSFDLCCYSSHHCFWVLCVTHHNYNGLVLVVVVVVVVMVMVIQYTSQTC